MLDLDIVTLGAATLNDATKIATVQTLREFGEDGETEPLGDAPLIQALGVTSLPLGPSDEGHAEGIVMTPCGSYTSAVIGGTDTRCPDVVGELAPGETCLHSTGEDATKRARVFCKENSLSLIVGNDTVVVIDRENKAINITAFGHTFEISESNGIMAAEKDGAWLQLKGGKATLSGSGTTIAGACTLGDASAMPLVKSVPLASYLTALEGLLTSMAATIDAKLVPTGTTAPAVAAFVAAGAAFKTTMAATFAKGT